jgi:acyl carrier protein
MAKVPREKLVDLISRVTNKPATSIEDSMQFRSDLRMDSLQSLDLLVLLEEEMGILVPQTDAAKIQSVQQLIDYVNK